MIARRILRRTRKKGRVKKTAARKAGGDLRRAAREAGREIRSRARSFEQTLGEGPLSFLSKET